MKTSDFYYDLPQELIAQTPIEKRDTSRLMTLDRVSGATGHHHFYDLPDYLNPGDCQIFGDGVLAGVVQVDKPLFVAFAGDADGILLEIAHVDGHQFCQPHAAV